MSGVVAVACAAAVAASPASADVAQAAEGENDRNMPTHLLIIDGPIRIWAALESARLPGT